MKASNVEVLTARAFKGCFEDCWDVDYGKDRNNIDGYMNEEASCTDFMLRGIGPYKKGFLKRVSDSGFQKIGRYDLELEVEDYYDLDAYAYKSGEKWPYMHMHLTLEHENRKNIQEEMRRLLDTRAPLKVLVCYDYWEDKIDDKIQELGIMNRDAYAVHPESGNTEYLLIVGGRKKKLKGEKYGKIYWRFWRATPNTDFKPI